MKTIVRVKENRENVIEELTELIQEISVASIADKGLFTVGISGGSVASFLTTALTKLETDFSKWRVFFCDERLVPEDDCDSTFGFYKSTICTTTNLKQDCFITVKQGVSAEEAARDYSQQIASFFPEGSFPRFDLLLLGMGPDGHTCSLFPGHPLLEEQTKWVAAITDSPKPPPARITLTFPVINNARNCIFAISGKEKAETVKKILRNKEDLPATRVCPTNGNLYWILDDAAAKLMNEENDSLI